MMQVKNDFFRLPKDGSAEPFVWLLPFGHSGERQGLP
jgi:hypothetical protein